MSEAVSALAGAVYDGLVRIEEAGPRGMITVRGDLSAAALRKAVTGVIGAAFPGQGEANFKDQAGICWMSPDELLVLCPHDKAPGAVAQMEKALARSHYLVADVSDARALFTLSGVDTREVLAKLCPADLSRAAFRPGSIRRSRLAQVPAAFWMHEDETVGVVCFRSVARYAFDALSTAAAPGSAVRYLHG